MSLSVRLSSRSQYHGSSRLPKGEITVNGRCSARGGLGPLAAATVAVVAVITRQAASSSDEIRDMTSRSLRGEHFHVLYGLIE